MKKPIDHFSLSDLRMSITEHEQPLFTLTRAEMEALVSRIEAAKPLIEICVVFMEDEWCAVEEQKEYIEAKQWLATLEREG